MVASHELILGGVRSGKSRAAESRAADWLADGARHAILIATATAGDEDMRERIERHRSERARRVPSLQTVEEAIALPARIERASHPQCLLVVDCLTLWLTNLMLPLRGDGATDAQRQAQQDALLAALRRARGPVVVVSNEIGLGVMPLGRETRRFVDALGELHRELAALCARVTWMAAGIELPVKPRGAA
jgi:adenosylcobinamide kinase / adenosylcobinamide-phosphate guanylyltransferase